LWDQLQAAHVKAWIANGKTNGKKGGKAKDSKAKPKLSKAEQKKRAEQLARQLAEREGRIKANWYRWLIHRELLARATGTKIAPGADLQRLLIFLHATPNVAAVTWGEATRTGHRQTQVVALAKERGKKIRRRETGWGRAIDGWDLVTELDVIDVAQYVASRFWDDEDKAPCPEVRACYLEPIVDYLGLDIPAAWRREQLGPLSSTWWNLYTKPQLAEQGKEVDVFVEIGKPKAQAVKKLSNPGRSLPMPKRLKRAKLID